MLTELNYHSDTSYISKSGLDLINRSPAHYWNRYLSGVYQETENQAFKIGSAFHCLTLEPNEFKNRYAVLNTYLDKRTKEGKTQLMDFMFENHGKQILTRDEFTQVESMAVAVNQSIGGELIEHGQAESIFTWQDMYTKTACKCKPDFINADRFIIDLKSTEDATAQSFGYSARKYRYDVQAAFYMDGLTSNGIKPKGFIFIAVEKQAPFNVGIYQVDAQTLETGRNKYIDNLNTYKDCLFTDDWTGIPNVIQTLQFPQ
jgi:exodeoxyribonuclease VIII